MNINHLETLNNAVKLLINQESFLKTVEPLDAELKLAFEKVYD